MVKRLRCTMSIGLWAVFFVLGSLGGSSTATAQPSDNRPEMWVTLEDGTRMWRITAGGDTLAPEWFSAGYELRMYTDSTCLTEYQFTGCKRNGVRIPLAHWKMNRAVNYHADILAYNSRTEAITLHEGDTLSFYRELSWKDPRFNRQALNNYRSHDTLTFAVELAGVADSSRVALLDSIGIMACEQTCAPTIHGSRPIMAQVFWVVPESLAGASAFIRVRPQAMGSGEYFFTRKEELTVSLWRQLLDPYWTTYLSQWQAFQKSIPLGTGAVERSADVKLVVRASTADRGAVSIDFDGAPDGGAVSLMIFDLNGNQVYTPFARTESSGNYSVAHRFAESGAYVVALAYGGAVVRTEKITITR